MNSTSDFFFSASILHTKGNKMLNPKKDLTRACNDLENIIENKLVRKETVFLLK